MTRYSIYFLSLALLAIPADAAAQDTDTTPSGDVVLNENVRATVRSAEPAEVDLPGLMEGIEATADGIRTIFTLSEIEIVELGERRHMLTPEIQTKLREHEEALAGLRNAIQGNALIYHAVDTNGVGIPEIVAAEISGENSVTIYAFSTQN